MPGTAQLERRRASRRAHHARHRERLNAARVERQRENPEQHANVQAAHATCNRRKGATV